MNDEKITAVEKERLMGEGDREGELQMRITLKALLFNAQSITHLSSESPFKPALMCFLHNPVSFLVHLCFLVDKVSPFIALDSAIFLWSPGSYW